MKVIEAKAEGAVVRPPKEKAARPTNVVDLVERLRASLAQTAGSSRRGGGTATASRKPATSQRKGTRTRAARKAKSASKSRRHVA
jgi:non-homologous end joining protein Ku